MIDKKNLTVKHGIIRIVGVFEGSKQLNRVLNSFLENSYENEEIKDVKKISGIKNYWYPEFRDLYFLKNEETAARILFKQIDTDVSFFVREQNGAKNYMSVKIKRSEIYLFRKQLNFFALELSIDQQNLEQFSDLTFCARNFDTEITHQSEKTSWVKWIEKNILCGIKISSDPSGKKVKVDDYSGSKFKLYTVLDLEEQLDSKTRTELLYDMGCVAPIGSAGGKTPLTPSDTYFDELLENKISVFNNYDILPLFDSFTVIGNYLLESEPDHYKNATWRETYFRIYIHNLFIKFNLFRYNSEMNNDSVAVRDEFEKFLNTYNLSHISYNFLPNLIYQKHRKSLDIDSELEKFQDRINRISQSIVEEKQSRTNLLLGLVGVVTSLSSIEPIFGILKSIQTYSGLGNGIFYSILSVILTSIAVPLLLYLFPDKTKQLKRKWRNRKN
jgi:hypothetical protein